MSRPPTPDNYERRRRSKEVACPVEFCMAEPDRCCVDVVGDNTYPHMSRVLRWERECQ